MKTIVTVAMLAGMVGAGCSQEPRPANGQVMKIQITSAAFAGGQPIPAKYTGDGNDASPPLAWTGVPPGARSLALIADDPDAPVGTWTHWVLYDLPPGTAGLDADTPKTPVLANGARQGLNDFKRTGYGGPAPPPGKMHRYFFKLYALDAMTGRPPNASKQELLKAMNGHVLGEGQLMGTYQR